MKNDPKFSDKVQHVLAQQNAVAIFDEQKRFAEHLWHSIRLRRVVDRQWASNHKTDDIIGLIQIARDAGDFDEAVWRTFLAVHFGRASADTDDRKIKSASRLLCAFDAEPHWTWKRVSMNRQAFYDWLCKHRDDLQTLAYGNHRKRRSLQPADIWQVVDSFLDEADRFGGPHGLIAADLPDGLSATELFDQLYWRFRSLYDFGRLGAFDFAMLLCELKLLSSEPGSCYLHGATGPRDGAIDLWGKRPDKELDALAVQLADCLSISPAALEDALCNWQKGGVADPEELSHC